MKVPGVAPVVAAPVVAAPVVVVGFGVVEVGAVVFVVGWWLILLSGSVRGGIAVRFIGGDDTNFLVDFDVAISRFKDGVCFGGICETFPLIFDVFESTFVSTSVSCSTVTLE